MKSKRVATRFGDFACEVSGTGTRPILLLHGGAANLRAWDAVIASMPDIYQCIAVDLPAHGCTEVQHLQFDDLSAALLDISVELSLNKPTLVGHSYGGLVAVTSAVRNPGFAAGVMAVDCYLASEEVQRGYTGLAEVLSHFDNFQWPWMETDDLEAEVERVFRNMKEPRESPIQTKAMIRRGYREQPSGRYLRFPRKEDEAKGVQANWSIDIQDEFVAVSCPLAIVLARHGLPDILQRRRNVSTISSAHPNVMSAELNCGHDIPGMKSEELAALIDQWLRGSVTQ